MATKKITLKALQISKTDFLNKYRELESVPQTAAYFGIGKWITRRLLDDNNIQIKGTIFTVGEREAIKEYYEKDFKKGETPLRHLAHHLNRCYHSVVREARRLGLTDPTRKCSKHVKQGMSQRSQEWHEVNPHPRGFFGHTHSLSARRKTSIRSKRYWKEISDDEFYKRTKKQVMTWRKNGHDKTVRGTWKASWREIGGKRKFFRSRWEANFARYLEFLKQNNHIQEWEHEPQTFWFEKIKRGVRSYLPDFKVTKKDGTHYWIEVKGWMDPKSKTKIKRFAKYYPDEHLQLIQKKWFDANGPKLRGICEGWE